MPSGSNRSSSFSKAFDRLDEGTRIRPFEEEPGRGFEWAPTPVAIGLAERANGIEGTAARERDHGSTSGLSLYGGDAEILELRIQQGARSSIQVTERCIVDAPSENDVGRRRFFEPSPSWAIADDHQPTIEASKRFDREGVSLVGYEAADQEIVVPGNVTGSRSIRTYP